MNPLEHFGMVPFGLVPYPKKKMDFSTDFDFVKVNILRTLLWDLYAVIISSMVVDDVDFLSPLINSNPNNNLRSENKQPVVGIQICRIFSCRCLIKTAES